jgi:hypothetical protein
VHWLAANGTSFVIPVGENEIFPPPLTSSMFELCSLFVQASQTGTVVEVDKDGNGTMDATVTLNQGETYYLERGLLREDPTTVTAVANASASAGVDGYYIPATISGLVYLDVNGNGQLQSPETGLAGVVVAVTDSRGIIHTVTTNSSGVWTAIVPPGLTTATIGSGAPIPTGSVTTQGSSSITLTTVAGTSADAGRTGYYLPATLSGHLYNDVDGSGGENAGDRNLPGVDVRITDSQGNVHVVTTDENGNWTVSLPPGPAVVDVDQTDPDFPVGGMLTGGTDPTNVTAVAVTDVPVGGIGYQVLGIVFGHLYVDVNQSGSQDVGEPNLQNITVKVTDANSIDHFVVSDANGNWTVNIPLGTAVVIVDESDPDFPEGADQSEGANPSNVVAVAGASVDAGIDGYSISTVVTGTIYTDLNNNGQRDAGNPVWPVSGWRSPMSPPPSGR